MIGHLIDHADMIKNQYSYIILREIAPEHVPSEEIALHNDKEEDKDDLKEKNWSMVRRNKRSGNKRDSYEAGNIRNYELSVIDTEEDKECEEDDDRHWQ